MKSTPIKSSKKRVDKESVAKKDFPIVAIGASTGGLEAMSVLLKNLPKDTGMAYIYVQHLNRDHKSFLTSIFSKLTDMEVQEIEDMEKLSPNHVYVIPNNKEIKVVDGNIQLLPRSKNVIANLSIDILFSSLAQTHKENVIGVVLSGNATDGTIGLKEIKDAGGITFAQDSSAQASGMPQSAIASGVVDYILSPKEIAIALGHLGEREFLRSAGKGNLKETAIDDNSPDLKAIFELLQKNTSVDFSHYKISTIKRRLNNRMLQCGAKTIKAYRTLLTKKKNHEIDLLYKDLLIHVTSFFRDTETFRYLKTTFLPKLLKNKLPGETLRIWIPACSTGEEAYSIAMLLTELQDKRRKIPIQIFATDLSEEAIRDARMGRYSQSDIDLVTEKRVKRFFSKTNSSYHIHKELRDMCVFAPHNILRDPPFFRMDFISCRNLLIYFDDAAQKKVFATLHFALNEKGYLMLGKSETTGTASTLFTQVNNKFKIYSRKKNNGVRKIPELTPRPLQTVLHDKRISASLKNVSVKPSGIENAIDSILLSRYMPACAVVNKDLEILQFRGSTSVYLRHSSGKASLNILKMIRPEFAFELRNAIHKVFKTKQTIRKSDIEMKIDGEFQLVSLEVSSLKIEWDEPLLLIVFTIQERATKNSLNRKAGKINTSAQHARSIKNLTTELNAVRAEMQTLIEAQEKSYEELQAANEEIVSTNEEYQTLNEELETSKEEIEATNEELISTNHELKTHNELLSESYEYSQTIIATIHEPMIILDRNLHVKFANKAFYKKFLVRKEETEGMLLFELGNRQWDIPKLRQLLRDSLLKSSQFENFEVTHTFFGVGERTMLLNASRIIQKTHHEKLILLAIEDITERNRYYKKERESLEENIVTHEEHNLVLEAAVKQRTKELHDKNNELESANKDLTSFTYVSSHDLQEPLRKIQNFISVLLSEEREALSERGKNYLQRTHETATRMRSLIEDLLSYSQTKHTDRKFEFTDLKIIVNEVKHDFKDILGERKATINATQLGSASVVHFQFHQLLNNLISNSLKFSKPRVSPRIVMKSKIMLGSNLKEKKLLPKTKYCHIIYTDNGIGFNPKYKERIFEVFQRLHGHDQYKGTGIGLAICKRIVELHNGIITATGEVNKGVRFDVYLPVIE